MKKLVIAILPLLLLVSCGNNVDKKNPGDPLILTSIEMSNTYGDATLIQYQNYDILIDTGTRNDAPHINTVLREKVSDKTLELVIFTHPHGDHIGGFINNALLGIAVNSIVDFGYTYQTNGSDEIDNSGFYNSYQIGRYNFINNGTKYFAINEALTNLKTIEIDKNQDCYLKWLKNDYYVNKGEVFPNEKVPSDNPNTTSVSCYVHYKKWNILLCGDADSMYTEQSIINNHLNLFKNERVILKATHHAANSSDGYNFLEWCHPELIYISAAMVNSVCVPNQVTIGTSDGAQAHPSRSTLKRLLQTTDNVYWNAINGDLTIKIDGINDASVQGNGRNKDYYDKEGNIASKENEKDVTIKNSKFYEYFK